MIITILYVILVVSTGAILCVGIAMYLRVRRLTRASDTQFCKAVNDGPGLQAGEQPEHRAAAAGTKTAQ